uniref:Uncharacterized protein n=1 Tax=Anguilla anguilla TaxID=7936 RepID=A0A0E9XXP1_ANGAN
MNFPFFIVTPKLFIDYALNTKSIKPLSLKM